MVLDDDGRLRAVAPLARSSSWGAGRLEMLGVRWLNEPADFVFTSREALAALIEGMLAASSAAASGRLPAESPTIEAFAAGEPRAGHRRGPPASKLPVHSAWTRSGWSRKAI